MRQVASAAGVSKSTVSNYLNQPSKVAPASAERIQRAIDQLGFVRNNAARQLRTGENQLIAYILPDLGNPFTAATANGVEISAQREGYSILIANSQGLAEQEASYLNRFEELGVRGILISSHGDVEGRLEAARSRGTHSVLLGRMARLASQPSVSVDNVKGGHLAASHLLGLGRRRLAFIGGPISAPQVSDRFEGSSLAVRAVEGATLEYVNATHNWVSVGQEIAASIAERAPGQRPDAIFAVNDRLAIGIEQALTERGVRLPDDIALVGFDDIEYAESSLIPLTSLRPPRQSIGAAAFDLLLAEMSRQEPTQEQEARHLLFEPELIVRASTMG
jgi:LacI family transcriptional regulator